MECAPSKSRNEQKKKLKLKKKVTDILAVFQNFVGKKVENFWVLLWSVSLESSRKKGDETNFFLQNNYMSQKSEKKFELKK